MSVKYSFSELDTSKCKWIRYPCITDYIFPLSYLQLAITYFPLFHLTVHVILVIFVFLVYTASKDLGSPKTVYNHLLEVSSKSRICSDPISHHDQSCGPISGNYKGSYLTMLSSGGLVFGIINIVGNFGTVFVDNVSCFSSSACSYFLLQKKKNLCFKW